MDEMNDKQKFQKPLESAHHSGLMGKSLEILQSLKKKEMEKNQQSAGNQIVDENIQNNKVEVEVGNVGTMKTVNSKAEIQKDLAKDNFKQKPAAPIVYKHGIYSIQKNLETSTVKVDPVLKALVDSVCRS